MKIHKLITDTIKMGKKGQITIPKIIRDEDNFKDGDLFKVIHTVGGEIILRKKDVKSPEDIMLEAIRQAPKLDAEAAWREILEERKRERS